METIYYTSGFDCGGRASDMVGYCGAHRLQARASGRLWEEVRTERADDLPTRKHGYLLLTPGRRTWRHLDTGETHVEIVPGYYRSAPDAPEGADICLYCGSDTTDIRICGVECAHCGGT